MSIFRISLLKEDNVRVEELLTPARARAEAADLQTEGLYGEALQFDAAARGARGKAWWDLVFSASCHALPDRLYAAWLSARRREIRHTLVCVY